MAIYKTGTITGTGSAINLNIGFVPSRFRIRNLTTLASGVGLFDAEWFDVMPNASAMTITTAGTPVFAYAAANGFTPFQTGDAALWTPTNLTITNISQAAQAVVTCANSLNAGDVVTFSGVVGMTQINTLRGVVVSSAGVSFVVNLNTTGFTAYTSGGIANVIASSNAAYCVTPVNGGPTQENVGQIGLTLGTGVCGAAADVIVYEAYLNAPFTS
jgi:hypothetical protein